MQNATFPSRSQELLPFLSVTYFFPPTFSTKYSSILSPHLAIYFLVYLSILLFPNSYITISWEFNFLPFSVHAVTIHNSQHKLHQSPPFSIHHCSSVCPNPIFCCLSVSTHHFQVTSHTCGCFAETHIYLGSSIIPSLTYPINPFEFLACPFTILILPFQ